MRKQMSRTAGVAALVMALAAGGCSHEGAKAGEAMTAQAPRPTSAAIGQLLAAVPGDATALAFIDIEATPWSMITKGALLPLDPQASQVLDRELRAYLDQHLGIDVSKLQYAVGYAAVPPMRGAVLLKTVTGAPKIPGGIDYNGGKVWVLDRRDNVSVGLRDGVVVCGLEAAVRDVLDTMAGKRKAVAVENPALVDWLRKETDGATLAVVAAKPKGLPLPLPLGGLERAVVSLKANRIAAAVEGEDASLTALQNGFDQATQHALAETQKAHDAAIAGNVRFPEGAGAIIAAAYAKSYVAKLKPQRAGNRLSVVVDIDVGATGAMAAVSVTGILAGVAVPAFMDYMKRSKKTEAALQLNKIGKSAKRAFAETGAFPKGEASLTPAAPCCGRGNGNHCPAAPELFAKNPVWAALDFQIDEPALFQYDYVGSADGTSFVAHAIGDLDCDGTMITYELKGEVANGAPRVTLTEPAVNAD